MSRVQDRLALVYAPLEAFRPPGEPGGLSKYAAEAESMEDLTTATTGEQKHDAQGAPITVLYEEHTPDSWINVSLFYAS